MEIESYFFKEGHSSVNVDLKVDSNELINHSFMIYTLCDVSPS
jgi:hypothetical protein